MLAALVLTFMMGSTPIGTFPVATYKDIPTCELYQGQMTVSGTRGMSIRSVCRDSLGIPGSVKGVDAIRVGAMGSFNGKVPPYRPMMHFNLSQMEDCVGTINQTVINIEEGEPGVHAVFFCLPVQKNL